MKHHLSDQPSRRRRPRAITSTAALSLVVCGLAAPATAAPAAEPPGAPGASTTWTTGYKDGVGTALSRESKVWYTLTGGTASEVYYPAADTPNTREMQFAVTDGTSAQRESDASVVRSVELADETSLTYRQVSTDRGGRWRLTKTYVTDPARASVVVDVDFENLSGDPLRLFAFLDPSLAGDAGEDSGATLEGALVSSDTHRKGEEVAAALVASTGFGATSTGYVGTSDGWTDLAADGLLDEAYPSAGPGNIAQVGEVPLTGASTSLTLALGFGADVDEALSTAQASAGTGYPSVADAYQQQWADYLASTNPLPRQLTGELATQYRVSLMTVRAHEDKTYPGAFIASLTIPWGQRVAADGAGGGGGGYHFVWARDLYQQVSALLAAGDTEAADRAVTWLFTRQQQPDGHFPQTSHPDGSPDQTNVQLDETAFPLVLAWQVQRFDGAFYRDHVKRAADYLVAAGPRTPQERWEETGGYSPSTLASQIAGLTAAADIARRNGDEASAAIYQGTADSWQRQTEEWMYTTTGPVGDGEYYLRIEGDGDPDDGDVRTWANGAGEHPENAVLDAGFLELVRLGVKAPDDPYVAGSLAETDASVGQQTPNGRMWHRYTYDGYGEKADGSPWDGTGIGRLWPLLSGERGEYELANGRDALPYLQTMHGAANAGYMIPEQAWDSSDPTSYGHVLGEGTGSAGPLAWAMAQYVRLAQGIRAGEPVETPKVVSDRYTRGPADRREVPALTLDGTSKDGVVVADDTSTTLTGTTDAMRLYVSVDGESREVPLQRTRGTEKTFSVEVPLASLRNHVVLVAQGRRGGNAQVERTVLSYGTRIGGLQDPAGDDDGPGTYTYPTNPVYAPGTFDLTGVDVYDAGDSYRFVTTIAGEITNPFGGQAISHQRVNVYLRGDGPASPGTADPAPALPGTNVDLAAAWDSVIVTDGRYAPGVYTPDGIRTAPVDLTAVPETRQVVTTVPKTALEGLDPTTAGYAVAMLGNAEDGEGIGNVRPVYDGAYWAAGNPSYVKEWRFGGGAGVLDDSPAKDTDTRDPNTLDVIVGSGQDQATVLDWTAGAPVTLPVVPLRP